MIRLAAQLSLQLGKVCLVAVHVEKGRIDHVARHVGVHHRGQVTAFNAHGCVKVHQGAFYHSRQGCFGCWIQAPRFEF